MVPAGCAGALPSAATRPPAPLLEAFPHCSASALSSGGRQVLVDPGARLGPRRPSLGVRRLALGSRRRPGRGRSRRSPSPRADPPTPEAPGADLPQKAAAWQRCVGGPGRVGAPLDLPLFPGPRLH